MLFGAGLVTTALWHARQINASRIQADLRRTIVRENQAFPPPLIGSNEREAVQNPALPQIEQNSRNRVQDRSTTTQVTIQHMEIAETTAFVEVLVSLGTMPTQRERRFYQRTNTGWQRMAPTLSFWGPQRMLDTEHIRFSFRQRDTSLLERASAEVDELYMTFHKIVGLKKNTAATKLKIEIVPDDRGPGKRDGPGRMTTSSPALRRLPVELTDVQVLTRSLFEPLLEEVVDEVADQVQIQPQWALILSGLRTWFRAEYSTAYLPQWPVVAAELYRQVGVGAPHTLEDILFFDIDSSAMFDPSGAYSQEQRAWAAYTVVAYIAASQGKAALPRLLRGLGQYDDWETLIPSVFNLPATEFERDWQAFVQMQRKD